MKGAEFKSVLKDCVAKTDSAASGFLVSEGRSLVSIKNNHIKWQIPNRNKRLFDEGLEN